MSHHVIQIRPHENRVVLTFQILIVYRESSFHDRFQDEQSFEALDEPLLSLRFSGSDPNSELYTFYVSVLLGKTWVCSSSSIFFSLLKAFALSKAELDGVNADFFGSDTLFVLRSESYVNEI